MDFSPETLRARFKELTGQRAKIDTKLVPMRAELDALVAGDTKLAGKKAQEHEANLRAQIKALQNELFPVEMERAAVARALAGKTGEPDA